MRRIRMDFHPGHIERISRRLQQFGDVGKDVPYLPSPLVQKILNERHHLSYNIRLSDILV